MQILNVNEYMSMSSDNVIDIIKTDVGNLDLIKILETVSDTDLQRIIKIINSINNQGITNINRYKPSYTINGTELPLYYMCTAEYIFLAALLNNYTHKQINIIDGVRELDNNTLRLFFKLFKGTDLIITFRYNYDEMIAKIEVLCGDL